MMKVKVVAYESKDEISNLVCGTNNGGNSSFSPKGSRIFEERCAFTFWSQTADYQHHYVSYFVSNCCSLLVVSFRIE